MYRAGEISYMEKPRRIQLPSWKCNYCKKRYETEKGFMDHKCRVKERIEELKTPLGQSAYIFYSSWMKANKRSAPSAETFTESKYYKTFVRFAEHVHSHSILDTDNFIRFMVDKDMSPTLWLKEQVFNMYVKEIEGKADIAQLFEKSLDTFFRESASNDVPLTSIITFLGVRRLMSLIRSRQISPFILFFCDQFGKLLATIDEDDAKELAKLMNGSYWKAKLSEPENDHLSKDFKMMTKDLGL